MTVTNLDVCRRRRRTGPRKRKPPPPRWRTIHLPLEPLLAYMEANEISHKSITEAGVSFVAARGHVTEWTADRIAHVCHVHPSRIWGDLWWALGDNLYLDLGGRP